MLPFAFSRRLAGKFPLPLICRAFRPSQPSQLKFPLNDKSSNYQNKPESLITADKPLPVESQPAEKNDSLSSLVDSLIRRRRVLNKAALEATGPGQNINFQDLGIDRRLLPVLKAQFGIEKPTAIQVSAAQPISRRQACLIQAATGTGKTMAFILPVLSQLMNSSRETILADQSPILFNRPVPDRGIRAIFVFPTAPLAEQAGNLMKTLIETTNMKMFIAASGSSQCSSEAEQRRAILLDCPDILVATPKRLLSLFFPHLAKARHTEEEKIARKLGLRRKTSEDSDGEEFEDSADRKLSNRAIAEAFKRHQEARGQGESAMSVEEFFRWQSMKPAGPVNEFSELLLSCEFLLLDEIDDLLPLKKFHSVKSALKDFEPIKAFLQEFRKINALAQFIGCSATINGKVREMLARLGWRNEKPVLVTAEGMKNPSLQGKENVESLTPATLPSTVSHHFALVPSPEDISSSSFRSIPVMAIQPSELERASWNAKGKNLAMEIIRAKQNIQQMRKNNKGKRGGGEAEALSALEEELRQLENAQSAHKARDPLMKLKHDMESPTSEAHYFQSKMRLLVALVLSHRLRHSLLVLHDKAAALRALGRLQGIPNLETIMINRENIGSIQAAQWKEIQQQSENKQKSKKKSSTAAVPVGPHRIYLATPGDLRGLDFPALDCVFVTAPERIDSVTDYIHLSGRTGRLGKEGFCVHLIVPEQIHALRPFTRLLGIEFQQIPLLPIQKLLATLFKVEAKQAEAQKIVEERDSKLIVGPSGPQLKESEEIKKAKAAPVEPAKPEELRDPIARLLSDNDGPSNKTEKAKGKNGKTPETLANKVMEILDERLDEPMKTAEPPRRVESIMMKTSSLQQPRLQVDRLSSVEPLVQFRPPAPEAVEAAALALAGERQLSSSLQTNENSLALAEDEKIVEPVDSLLARLSPMSNRGYWFPEYDDENNWVEEEEPQERALRLIREERELIEARAERKAKKILALRKREELKQMAFRVEKAGLFTGKLLSQFPENAKMTGLEPLLVDADELENLTRRLIVSFSYERLRSPRPISAFYEASINPERFIDQGDQLAPGAPVENRIVKNSAIKAKEREKIRRFFRQQKIEILQQRQINERAEKEKIPTTRFFQRKAGEKKLLEE